MKKEYSKEELFHKAASYCSISEHCIADVEQKLFLWKVEKEMSNEIIKKLIEDDFINEKRFSEAFVRDKFRFNKWGKMKIGLALREKKIDKTIIENALNVIDVGEYEEMLAQLLKNKLQTIKYDYEYEKQGKLFKYAQSKGFETNVIERIIRFV